MNSESDFKNTFNDLLGNRVISVAKLSELSGVPERYIEAMRVGNFDHLPPAPYVHGYLNKVAAIFSTDPEELWRKYKNECEPKVSGVSDRLPKNRYSFQTISKGKIAIGVVVLCLLVYSLLRFSSIIGAPKLVIENPKTATIITSLDHFEVQGLIKPGDQLTINGESEFVSEDGKFKKDIRLFPGINTVEFKVKRFLGQEVQDLRKIIYSPENKPTAPLETSSTQTNANTSSTQTQ